MEEPTDTFEDVPVTREARCRVEGLHPACAADMEVATERAQWWGPRVEAHWDANPRLPACRGGCCDLCLDGRSVKKNVRSRTLG